MVETGLMLRSTREKIGISLEEVSRDINISVLSLEQIEAGAVGSFNNIYELKDMILEYSKYLGLDADDVEKRFNEYMFEHTSKIPMQEIEKAIAEQLKENDDEDEIHSPYTKISKGESGVPYIIVSIVILLLIILCVLWSIKQLS